ncbi:MAG: hypothetical protein ACKVU4_15025 [Phycisphaerales bacterium]
MLPSDLVRRVASFCEAHGVQYFVTGSVASTLYSVYRTTHDVDIVVALPPGLAREFCASFPEAEFYADAESALQTALDGGMFNIIEHATGLKIDVIVPKDTPFDASRIARARRIEFEPGLAAMFASPEDVILSKLVFYREGQSQKHLNDIGAMLRVQGTKVDRAYIEMWAPRIGVSAEWRLMQDRLREFERPAGPGAP